MNTKHWVLQCNLLNLLILCKKNVDSIMHFIDEKQDTQGKYFSVQSPGCWTPKPMLRATPLTVVSWTAFSGNCMMTHEIEGTISNM